MNQNGPGIRLGEKLQLRTARKANQGTGIESRAIASGAQDAQARKLKSLSRQISAPVTSISSFMALVAELDPPFKPITLHRPWSISAGSGATASVEVHRYVPGRNFNLFNDKSPIKLKAYPPDVKRTGDYYAIKRLRSISNTKEASSSREDANHFAQLATELRILAHPDLHGHPNLVYLFGVSHSPSHDRVSLAEPNLVLQEGDCGDLFNFCRAADLSSNLHALVEVKLSLCFDIACGLEALHKHGVAHTDLKPQNILVRRRDGRSTMVKRTQNAFEAAQVAIKALSGQCPFVAMLTDFGGSSIFADSQNGKMRKGMYTPLWCAPELYTERRLSKQDLTSADIYSAGLVVAFILMEGRDVFTTVVERGMMHSEDTTLDPDEVKRFKTADMVLNLAKDAVANFETCVIGITATGERIYYERDIMYQPPQMRVFNAILDTCLSSDPSKRVSNASEILSPWKTALESEFHIKHHMHYRHPELFQSYYRDILGSRNHYRVAKTCVRPDGRCQAIPAAFTNSRIGAEFRVFDIQQSFSIFRASLTSGLKTQIFEDLRKEAGLVESIQRHLANSLQLVDVVPKESLLKAAESAYQVGIAYLEGFGTHVSDRAALRWIGLAAQWGSQRAMAAYLPLSRALGTVVRQRTSHDSKPIDLLPEDKMYELASQAITMGGHPNTAALLSKLSHQHFITAIEGGRKSRAKGIWDEFQQYSKLSKKIFDIDGQHHIRDYFKTFQVDFNFPIGKGWAILHYAAFSDSVAAVQKLVQFWGADVRSLSLAGETALDVAIEAGHDKLVDYLLSEHEKLAPAFYPNSCPLMNLACLPVKSIPGTAVRILRMNEAPDLDARNAATGRTALMHTLLTETSVDPEARDRAIEVLLAGGANPLLTTSEPGAGSPLMFAVLELRFDYVQAMLEKIQTHQHALVFSYSGYARPEPANELARCYFYLMKKMPRSRRLSLGVGDQDRNFSMLISVLTQEVVAKEIPYACGSNVHNFLSLACYYGNAEVAKIMVKTRLEAGLSVKSHLDGEGSMSALHTAIDCGFADVLDVFFPLMMDRPDIADWNVLSSAIHHQPALVPKIFSYYEAKEKHKKLLDYSDPWGASALDTALEYGYLDLAKFLLKEGATYDEYRLKGDHSIDEGKQSTLASVIPHMSKIKLLMELSPPPRLVVTESGFNVFHVLAADAQLIGVTVGSTEFDDVMNYFHDLDNLLIKAKAGAQGMTPFHIVSLHYSEVVGSFLHKHDADINALDDSGYTPLDYLEFHAKGEQAPSGQQLTISFLSPTTAKVGHTICDYALAGPVYRNLETRLLRDLKAQYKIWGAKTGEEVKAAAIAQEKARKASMARLTRSLGRSPTPRLSWLPETANTRNITTNPFVLHQSLNRMRLADKTGIPTIAGNTSTKKPAETSED